MNHFEYLQPTDLAEASRLLGDGPDEAMIFAGGTDMLSLLKDDVVAPRKLINIKGIPGLDDIRYTPGNGLVLGPLVTIRAIKENPTIREHYPVLAEAADVLASPQLRNLGTLGGNLCQRPRCWYFRGDFDCLRKGGATCYALEGRNKYHCIIGGHPCVIVHPSDMAVALLALDAKVTIYTPEETRQIPLNEFFVRPAEDYEREHVLKPGEIMSRIEVPAPPSGMLSGYRKFMERAVWDFAVVSVAAVFTRSGDRITGGRVSFGGVAPVPWQDEAFNRKLSGLRLTKRSVTDACKTLLSGAEPLSENAFKLPLARNLTGSLLLELAGVPL
ncbi:MAG: xanthine dehydrogenase family protein subunit M [Acidobacteria bacterium]|nr:xanthine dehydrogenase family protein subunit M [Acidobacteriota bacterium]